MQDERERKNSLFSQNILSGAWESTNGIFSPLHCWLNIVLCDMLSKDEDVFFQNGCNQLIVLVYAERSKTTH